MNLAIEIGGTKLQLALAGETGKICDRRKFAVETSEGAAGIRRQIEQGISDLCPAPQAIGVGFGGPVDWKTGKVSRSHQIEGWSDFDLAGWLHRLTGAPVFVDNDANLAALGEARRGAGVGFNPVFYVTLGSGVGGGLVVDGKVYHGASPGESEIGHLRLERTGTTVESRCSGWAVDAKIRKLKTSKPGSILARIIGPTIGGEARHLAAALQQGDSGAQSILDELADDLAFGLSHVVHLFHPQIIVLGGGLSGVGEPLRAAVQGAVGKFTMKAFSPGPPVVLAALGEDAVPLGALELMITSASRPCYFAPDQ